MKRLILTRHAKSGWDNLELSDHERPLNKRGQAACKLIAKWLTDNGYIPQQAIASTATRCMQTWEGIGLAMECDAPVTYESGLYHASADVIIKQLRKATADTVLLTAHNPGIGESANRFCKIAPTHPRFFSYPTAATTIIDFELNNWAEVTFGTGACRDFVTPRDVE